MGFNIPNDLRSKHEMSGITFAVCKQFKPITSSSIRLSVPHAECSGYIQLAGRATHSTRIPEIVGSIPVAA